MKVGILTLTTKEGGGVYQYCMSLLEAFKKHLTSKFRYIQITNNNFPQLLDDCITINSMKSSVFLKMKILLYTFSGIKIGDILGIYNHPDLKKLDFIISPLITLLPHFMQKPYIVTIHDFQQEYHPEFFTLKERISRKIIYKTGQKANIVICESKYVKKDIIRFLGVAEERIKVIESPPPSYLIDIKFDLDKLSETKKKYDLPEKYLFYPAQFWHHKNHLRLLSAVALVRDKYHEKIDLVFVGSKKNNFENTMIEIEKLNLQSQVKYLGYVPEDDMPYLYKLSTALVMPTLFESLSMPIWESFTLGIPVVSSNVCALPEQVGDAGLLFDPYNIEDMAEKIYKIWTDEDLRKELIKKGYERVKDLTLENYAKQWEAVIEEALENVTK